MDEESQVKVRKYNKNVEISGGAMIMFGAWTVVRFLLSLILKTDEMAKYSETANVDNTTYLLIVFLASTIVLVVVMAFHLSVGLGAIRYARGKTKRKGFLILSVLVMLTTILTMPSYLTELEGESNVDTTIASFLVDVTMIFIQIDMLSSVIRLERLKKKAADRG